MHVWYMAGKGIWCRIQIQMNIIFFSYKYRYFQGVMFASPSIVNKIEIWSDLEAASSANNLIFARGDVWANLPRRYSIVQKHTQLNNMI